MSIFEWNPDWETGNERIDKQHRELFRQMERLLLSLTEGGVTEEVERTLLLLGDYIATHFNTEEALMLEQGYPGRARHMAVHGELRRKVEALVVEYQLDSSAISASVLDFLVTWLKEHLAGEDHLMAAFLREAATHTTKN